MTQHDGTAAGAGGPAFRERLAPSAPTWLLVPGAGGAAALVLWPVSPLAGVVGAVAIALVVAAALWQASTVVAVHAGELVAGRARVPLDLLGDASAHRGPDARHERGPGLDARAHLCIRGWVDPVVKVALRDPADPTPYWLVSSRRPEELAGLLSRRGG